MKNLNNIGRRQFIGQASCAGLGYITLLNSLINLKALNSAAISDSSVNADDEYKAIVCVMKGGGHDSWNMLVPHDVTNYDEYAATRGNIALDQSELLHLNSIVPYGGGREFGMHPSMTAMRDMYEAGKVALLTNIGTLVRPTTKQNYDDKYMLPKGLFSHSDQVQEWHTSIADKRTFVGWAGRMADLLMDQNTNQLISMNMSLSGNNVLQTGESVVPYSVSRTSGSVGMTGYDPETANLFNSIRTEAIDSLLADTYSGIFEKTYTNVLRNARDAHIQFDAALSNSVMYDAEYFPDTLLGDSLEMIARTIDIREDLGFKRQVFFVVMGGYDMHSELLMNQSNALGDVSDSLQSFMNAMEDMSMENNVLTINLSEFGRTLTWNGGGTDHAWGGNVWVTGGTDLINGGQIHGDFPSLAIENNDNNVSNRGRLIPGLSTDEYFTEIAKWFGVPNSDLSYIFPNIGNFYDVNSADYPIGFLKNV